MVIPMKFSVKCGVTLLVMLLLGLGAALSAAAADYRRIPITYEGKTVMGGEALLIDSTTYVPFRAVCDALGEGVVGWNNKTKTATFTSKDLNISATCYSTYIEANGRYFYCEKGIKNVDSRIYVPIRPMAKAFGITVTWDPSYRVSLTGGEALLPADEVYDESDLLWLSRIISAESRGESLLGKIAVGNVVMNRVATKAFPNTIREVIFQNGQFTPVKNGHIYDIPTEESIIAAKLCLEGAIVTDKALYFCNPAIATGTWIQRNRVYLVTIGNHAFYA
jgi:N-acetylmuramoyl-L-alanine amidase